MTLLFNNLYIFLFIILLIIYILLITLLKETPLNDDTSIVVFARYLKTLRNNNISFSVFILFVYLGIVISPLLLLRINRLGLVYDLPNMGEGNFNYKLYIPVIFAVLSFVLILKIVNFILYLYVIKIHFYLYYKSKYYDDKFTEYAFFKEELLRKYLFAITIFISNLIQNNNIFISRYKNAPNVYHNILYEHEHRKRKWLFYLYLRSYVHKYSTLKALLIYIHKIFSSLEFYTSRCLYYAPYSLLVITLGYDFTHGVIQYTFYATLYLYITNIIKKIRKFYKEKDQVLDHVLGVYFYSDVDVYNYFNYYLEKDDKVNMRKYGYKPEIQDVFNNRIPLIDYITTDFVVEHVRRPDRAQGRKVIFNTCKRLNILFVLLLFNIYILYYNKYILVVNNTSISLTFISIIYLGLMYYLHRQIPEATEDSWIEHKTPKRLFYILLLILSMFLGFIFLKNKLTLYPQDIIISFQDIISIKENFNLMDKLNYAKKYINHLKLDETLDKHILDKIQKDIIENNLISIDMIFKDIKELIMNLYNQENMPQEVIKKETLLEKVYKIIGYKR